MGIWIALRLQRGWGKGALVNYVAPPAVPGTHAIIVKPEKDLEVKIENGAIIIAGRRSKNSARRRV